MKKQAEDTPLIKQFFAVKAQYPEAVLLYRVGDFYESYASDAVLISKVLGLVLTGKTNGEKGRIEMAGFPYHALENYLPKLVRAGYKVAVCDQLEDPKLAAGKKLVKRGVTELVTPGVTFRDQLLEQKENNYLAGLSFDRDLCGAAFLDVSTGSFQVAQGSTAYIGTLLASLSPKELVVERGCDKRVRELFGEKWYISTLEEWAFTEEAAAEKLRKQLDVRSLKGFAIEGMPLAICSAGALLVYLARTCHDKLGSICSLSRIDEGHFVWMDRFTFRNLEVFHSTVGGEGTALVDVIDRCASPMGARLLRTWLAMPVLDTDELNSRYDTVSFFLNNSDILQSVQDNIGEIGDMERILSRAATGRVAPRELVQLGRGLSRTPVVMACCQGKGCAPLDALLEGVRDCSQLYDAIRTTLADTPAAALGKGEVIAAGIDPELDDLRSLSGNGREYLLKMQEREAERTGIASLKIGFNNVFGYYIEVRNTFKDNVPPEWIRKQTLVSAERYITEELKEYEAKILGAEQRILEIESRIYADLVARVQGQIGAIQANCRILSRLDVLSGLAALASSNRYCRPEVDRSRVLDIKGGRHPVIETMMEPGEEYIPNDIRLDNARQQIIVLTGPNMAGKSALLRQTALIVLLAQIGSFVPADSARIGICDKIFTRVGASDNISRGESTFMVEMLETSMILHNLSDRSLVLLDEIGRGTSTFDGMSIARAIVEYIHEHGKGAKTLFATHYHELNDLAGLYPRVKNFHVTVKEVGKQVIFLRKIKEGGTAHSFGIHVARMAGMPRPVLEAAERTLAALESGQNRPLQPSRPDCPQNAARPVSDETDAIQLSLFQLDDPTLTSLRDQLREADLNNMTPMQAFDLLRSMKAELGL